MDVETKLDHIYDWRNFHRPAVGGFTFYFGGTVINSRNLDDLIQPVASKARAFIEACELAGIDLLITSTYRDHESQDALYAQGRSLPGKRVTNARGGQSFHNYRVAFDVVPLRNGKPVWNTSGADAALWEAIGKAGEAAGLEWAGRWKKFKEMAHFQYTGGHDLTWFQTGNRLA